MLDVMKNGQGSPGVNQEHLQTLIESCQGIHNDLLRLAHIPMVTTRIRTGGILTAVFSGFFFVFCDFVCTHHYNAA